jgi:hypothetical protein
MVGRYKHVLVLYMKHSLDVLKIQAQWCTDISGHSYERKKKHNLKACFMISEPLYLAAVFPTT